MSKRPEDLLSCGVCLEQYKESAPHMPRILPCAHTLCERCLIQLLGGGAVLKCPECRTQLVASNKEKTFPQNKYLLTVIRKLGSEIKEPEAVRFTFFLISLFEISITGGIRVFPTRAEFCASLSCSMFESSFCQNIFTLSFKLSYLNYFRHWTQRKINFSWKDVSKDW